jgi:hypothetical protein
MLNKIAMVALFILVSVSACAASKVKETITLQVVTSNTRIHGKSAKNLFAYTDLMFTRLNGEKIVYQCVQHGNICPMMESGKAYTADRQGDFIYITMDTPIEKKPLPVKFRQVGSW